MAAQDAAFKFSVSMPGQETFSRAIQRFADQIQDWSPFWETFFRDAWYRHVETHYTTQGRSTGEAWPPLSEAYGAWKQKHWPGLPIGVLSGATRESLTFRDDRNAVWEASKTGLTVGTRVPYAIFQQLGTQRSGAGSGLRPVKNYSYGSGGGMPARPPLRVTSEFVMLMGQLMQEYAVKTLRGQLEAQ